MCDAHRYLLVELDQLASLLGGIEINDGCVPGAPLLSSHVVLALRERLLQTRCIRAVSSGS
jgi:hypothetical protein